MESDKKMHIPSEHLNLIRAEVRFSRVVDNEDIAGSNGTTQESKICLNEETTHKEDVKICRNTKGNNIGILSTEVSTRIRTTKKVYFQTT